MRVRDFGHFDAPLVIFGGVCGNLPALAALAEVVGDKTAISTGGLVGPGSGASATVRTMRDLGWPTVSSPADRALLDAEGDGLHEDDRSWVSALPDLATFVQDSRRYAVLNTRLSVPEEPIWPSSSDADITSEVASVEALVGPVDGVIVGGSGVAFHRRVGAHSWIDAGAIGSPPNDGRIETRYGLLVDGEVVFHRLEYDHEAAVKTLGASSDFALTLKSGVWPDQEALPPELRR